MIQEGDREKTDRMERKRFIGCIVFLNSYSAAHSRKSVPPAGAAGPLPYSVHPAPLFYPPFICSSRNFIQFDGETTLRAFNMVGQMLAKPSAKDLV